MLKSLVIKYIRNNKTASLSLAAIPFIAAAFLSLIIGIMYNLMIDFVIQNQVAGRDPFENIRPSFYAYAFVLVVICISLVAMIHNAFEVSMNTRVRQMGILQSIGATPRQIRSVLLGEAFVLCLLPILAGIVLGVLLCFGFIRLIITFGRPFVGYEVRFYYHAAVAVFSFCLSIATALISAWMPARKISRLIPVDAIRFGDEQPVGKIKKYRIFSSIFGIYGELARKSIYSRKKLLRTSSLSLAFAFLSLVSFLNFETLSGISTQETYFERYQDIWDIMLVVENPDKNEDILLREIRNIPGIESCISYKKVIGQTNLTPQMLSPELEAIGPGRLTEDVFPDADGNYVMQVPIYVLDDESFARYRSDNHLPADDNAVTLNRIWDSQNSSRTDRIYLPLLRVEDSLSLEINNPELPHAGPVNAVVTGYADAMPMIREEFVQNSLSLIISETLYDGFSDALPYAETCYNIKITSAAGESAVMDAVLDILQGDEQYTISGRVARTNFDADVRRMLNLFMGILAALLSLIGLSNVFSATLGQISQRKREFIRYLSIGISPKGMKKILLAEVFIISFRPLLLTFLINIPLLALALNYADNISLLQYLQNAPYVTVISFSLLVFLCVGLAYTLISRQITGDDMITVLKDETMI